MKKLLVVAISILLGSCQTVKIKQEQYKKTEAILELGSVGESKSLLGLKNDFNTRTFPKLENKIRVSVESIPFTKALDKAYKAKSKYNQNQGKVVYNDSLPVKPEIVLISVMDVAGFVTELNSENNKEISQLVQNTKKMKVVSNIAVVITKDDLAKIKQVDTYYLINNLDKKYTLQLYKQGKKSDVIDITHGTTVAYKLGKFCWNVNERGKWYIADIVDECEGCKGNTQKFVSKKKKEKSLFDM